VRRLIGEGAFGRPLVGVCNTLWFRPEAYYAVPWRGRWETELGGATLALAIHIVDLLLCLLGEWTEVYAVMESVERRIEDENVSLAVLRFASGAVVSVTTSAVSPRQESYLRLDFSRATVELTTLYGYTNADWRFSLPPEPSADEVRALGEWRALPPEKATSQATQLRALIADMAANRRPAVSGEEVRRTIELVLSIYKSATTREAVTRGSISPGDPFYAGMSQARGSIDPERVRHIGPPAQAR
jgi:predicted dehydrogenase